MTKLAAKAKKKVFEYNIQYTVVCRQIENV